MKVPSLKLNRNAIGVAIALVIGGISFYAARHQLAAHALAVRAEFEAQNRKEPILVVRAEMQAGEILTMAHIAQRNVPVKFTPSQALTGADLEMLIGQRLVTAMKPGDPILRQSVESPGFKPFSTELEQGRRAITFPVDEVNSFSGLLSPGDVIDLLYSIETQQRNGQAAKHTVRPILQQVMVLATGTVTRKQKIRDATGIEQEVDQEFATVTLHVAPEEAQRIILAERTGTLTAMLRNPHDQSVLSDAPLSSDALFATGKARGKARASGRSIELIIGNGAGAQRYLRMPVAQGSLSPAPQPPLASN
jgi:pilus assembly protein CpaB